MGPGGTSANERSNEPRPDGVNEYIHRGVMALDQSHDTIVQAGPSICAKHTFRAGGAATPDGHGGMIELMHDHDARLCLSCNAQA